MPLPNSIKRCIFQGNQTFINYLFVPWAWNNEWLNRADVRGTATDKSNRTSLKSYLEMILHFPQIVNKTAFVEFGEKELSVSIRCFHLFCRNYYRSPFFAILSKWLPVSVFFLPFSAVQVAAATVGQEYVTLPIQ
jgi:hypothetical protein